VHPGIIQRPVIRAALRPASRCANIHDTSASSLDALLRNPGSRCSRDDGQLNLPSGGHTELLARGQHDYLA